MYLPPCRSADGSGEETRASLGHRYGPMQAPVVRITTSTPHPCHQPWIHARLLRETIQFDSFADQDCEGQRKQVRIQQSAGHLGAYIVEA